MRLIGSLVVGLEETARAPKSGLMKTALSAIFSRIQSTVGIILPVALVLITGIIILNRFARFG
jgi:hypothetical protein